MGGFIVADASVCRNPVGLPSFTAVVGEGLLEVNGVGGDVVKNEADVNRAAAKIFLIVKFAAAIGEFAGHGDADAAVVAGGVVEIPEMCVGIVEAEGKSFDIRAAAVNFEFGEVGAAVPDFADFESAVDGGPIVRAGERVKQALDVGVPVAKFEVKVVAAVALLGG